MNTKTAWLRHPSEDALENYARHKLDETESSSLEAHLLACDSCQEALRQIDDLIWSLKEASIAAEQSVPAGKPALARVRFVNWRLRRFNFAWFSFTPGRVALAGATAMLCAFAFVQRPASSPQSQAPAAVTLTAFRGGDPAQGATAPAGRPVALAIEVPDLPAATQCRAEIVDADGRAVWSGIATAQAGSLHLTEPKALSAGDYWVRLYTSGPEPIREFGLLVK